MRSRPKEFLKAVRLTALNLILFLIFASLLFAQTKNDSSNKPLSGGELIYQTEKLLSERGYWITKVDKIKDSSTYHAIAAFQKVENRKRTGVLNIREFEAIRNAERPKPVYVGAKHIEIDLNRQVLFLVDENDVVTHILPVSTGNGKAYYENGKKQIAYTPRGIFKITRQIKGIRKAPLGTLYHPNYFYNGVAIHGSDSIPFYPASHGCVRIPRFSAKDFSDLVTIGLLVVVHKLSGQTNLPIGKSIFQKNELENVSQNSPYEVELSE